jgi:hypothetical protein
MKKLFLKIPRDITPLSPTFGYSEIMNEKNYEIYNESLMNTVNLVIILHIIVSGTGTVREQLLHNS